MARQRSPNYPNTGLQEAIRRAKEVYKLEHTMKADPATIAKDLGYNGINGASLTAISTLKKFGLLTEEGTKLRISDDALTIMEYPENSPEYAKACLDSAYKPSLFAELHNEFGDRLPSEHNLRAYLIKRGFSQSALDSAIRAYRETSEFVSVMKLDYIEDVAVEEIGHDMTESSPQIMASTGGAKGSSRAQAYSATVKEFGNYLVSKGCTMRILADGPVTSKGIENLISYLQLAKDALKDDDSPTETASDRR